VDDMSQSVTDLATREHWDAEWAKVRKPLAFGRVWPDRVLADYIQRHLGVLQGKRLIELGAGNSRYLPGLAMRFGVLVSGLDYSAVGADLARRNLAEAGVEAEVVVADLFDPPVGWQGRFDYVMTFGVVEHFDDTAAVIRAAARYLAPRGRMLTLIPNMRGIPGVLTRWMSHDLYERHVPMTADQLARAHQDAGLVVERLDYAVGFDGWVVNPGASPTRWKRWLYKPVLALTRLLWALEERFGWIKPNRISSPWVIAIAHRSAEDTH
jgi:SAM-dependent methyltransferase